MVYTFRFPIRLSSAGAYRACPPVRAGSSPYVVSAPVCAGYPTYLSSPGTDFSQPDSTRFSVNCQNQQSPRRQNSIAYRGIFAEKVAFYVENMVIYVLKCLSLAEIGGKWLYIELRLISVCVIIRMLTLSGREC